MLYMSHKLTGLILLVLYFICDNNYFCFALQVSLTFSKCSQTDTKLLGSTIGLWLHLLFALWKYAYSKTHAKEILAENINELQVEIFFYQGVMGSMGFMVLKKGKAWGRLSIVIGMISQVHRLQGKQRKQHLTDQCIVWCHPLPPSSLTGWSFSPRCLPLAGPFPFLWQPWQMGTSSPWEILLSLYPILS